ncbi:hypothetical protein B0H13DRAFT_1591288 [Mycena leptocephala]|nr:hypothetical protein B0H13DRAFT_1591288 [Mycena leptocephala]
MLSRISKKVVKIKYSKNYFPLKSKLDAVLDSVEGIDVGREYRVQRPDKRGRLSMSELLNALDGVGAQEGRILFATTNKYSALDPALCRPGRMDLHIEFKLASNPGNGAVPPALPPLAELR